MRTDARRRRAPADLQPHHLAAHPPHHRPRRRGPYDRRRRDRARLCPRRPPHAAAQRRTGRHPGGVAGHAVAADRTAERSDGPPGPKCPAPTGGCGPPGSIRRGLPQELARPPGARPAPSSTCSAPPAGRGGADRTPRRRSFALLRALRAAHAAGRVGHCSSSTCRRSARRSRCSPCPSSCAAICAGCCRPSGRRPARCARARAARRRADAREWLYETAARWEHELAAVQAVLELPRHDRTAGRRAGPAAADALRTARAGLAPARPARSRPSSPTGCCRRESADPWLAALSARQQDVLKALRTSTRAHERDAARTAAPRPRPARRRRPRHASPPRSSRHGVERDRCRGRPSPVRSPGSRRGPAAPRTGCWCGTSRCPAVRKDELGPGTARRRTGRHRRPVPAHDRRCRPRCAAARSSGRRWRRRAAGPLHAGPGAVAGGRAELTYEGSGAPVRRRTRPPPVTERSAPFG